MHTITERSTLLGAAALALAAWFAALAIVAYAAEPSRYVIAWVPDERMAATLSAAPVSVLEGESGGFLLLRGESPGFVRALYETGAWVVFPAISGGCRSDLSRASLSARQDI
jgi:hypothetical protein